MNNKKKKINGKKILIAILISIILIFLIYKVFDLIKNPTDKFLVENGKLNLEESFQGYVIREEEVIKGENYKNGMEKIKTEGEKVAKGEAIFRYYTSGKDEFINKISELDTKIAEALEKEENSIVRADVKSIENQIQNKMEVFYKQNDIQKIKEYKNDLNTSITKKAKIAGELSPAGSYLKELIDQRSELENKLNNGSEYVKATKAGIVSYRVDGLEEVLKTTDFSSINKKTLEDLNLKTGQVISTSEESGKIINNFECYLAVIINSDKISNFKIGDKIKIRLSGTSETDAKIEYMAEENDKENIVILKVQKYVEKLIDYRKISFDIIWWNAEGLKVPNEAIKQEKEDLYYVIRKRNNYTDKIYIKILKQNENYSIIDNYTYKEFLEKGFTKEEENNRGIISLHDEVIV